MNEIIDEVLPLALAIAISPIPIMATVLILLSPRARSSGVGFLLGWVLGILAVVAVSGVAATSIHRAGADRVDPLETSRVVAIILILAGALLIVLAGVMLVRRLRRPRESATPGWMSTIGELGPGKAFVLALALAVARPKNLIVGVSSGITIGTAGLDGSRTAVALGIFTVIASSAVALPIIVTVIVSVAVGDRMSRPLTALKVWLETNNTSVMTVLMVVVGALVLGEGLAKL